METDDELAAVLGHEMEHIDHYHCAERLQAEAALRRIPLGSLLGIPIQVFEAGYSKDQELEADREGVLLAARAGYSAAGAVRIFKTLDGLFPKNAADARSPQQELSRVAADVLTGYFRSHPAPADRIRQIEALIAAQPSLAANPERSLGISYIFLAWHASDLLLRGKFDQAAELAGRSLEMKPGHKPALEVASKSKFALRDLAGAKAAYLALLSEDATAAAAVEAWAEERARGLIAQAKYDEGTTLVQALLELQPNQPGLLALLAEAQFGSGKAAEGIATAATLRRLYPARSEQFAADDLNRALSLLNDKNFSAAAEMAQLSAALDDSASAERVLADSEFAAGRFVEAAAAYERVIRGREVDDVSVLGALADALASAHPATAYREFQEALATAKQVKVPPPDVDSELAGLAVMGRRDAPALILQREAERGAISPEVLGRLGWWYFRAHRVEDAAALLQSALRLRPGDDELQANLAWVRLEAGDYSLQGFPAAGAYRGVEDTPEWALAISHWAQNKPDEALATWSTITSLSPQWLNREWRGAIYPPHINALVDQMQAEQQRRELAARAAAGR
ncbi:MAG: M48 family metalloprotease [Acidobacteria bacterium]|nr:M48 family metalloprotease [Acidobacteriota bacterium]